MDRVESFFAQPLTTNTNETSSGSSLFLPQIPLVPIEQALEHVEIVAALARRVAFVWVEDHLGFGAEMFQRAVESFRLTDGIGLVVDAVEDQGRRFGTSDEG